MKNVGQFDCCKTVMLSGPGSCPLADCHPGTCSVADALWGWEVTVVESLFNCSVGAHPAEVSSALLTEGTA